MSRFFTNEQIDTAVALAKRNRKAKSGKTGFEVAERYLRRYSSCTFGVEQVTCACNHSVLAYLNLGDTYDYTVCRAGREYFADSWGNWLEEQERKYDEQEGTIGCAYCGHHTPLSEEYDWNFTVCEQCGHCVDGDEAIAAWHSNYGFTISMPFEAIKDCSHSGACDDDVSHWAPRINRPEQCTPEALRKELSEYGAWDDDQLADDDENWERIIWIAAGNIQEEWRENSSKAKRRRAALESADLTDDVPNEVAHDYFTERGQDDIAKLFS